MRATVIDRRQLLKAGLGAGLCGLGAVPAQAQKPQLLLASAYALGGDEPRYAVSVCGHDGRERLSVPLPARGHSCLFRPGTSQLLVFARRPGRFLQVLDLSGAQPPLQVDSVAGRHFYGHGCFNHAATRLYVSENDYDAARGVIGVYDATRGYRRMGEFPSGGVGPHDVKILSDGRTLVVANGGIETHPASGREKLNLFEMHSSISFIDAPTGQLLQRFSLSDHWQKLSLRHLAVNAQDEVFFGAQYQGAREQMPPLMGSVSRAAGIRSFELPAAVTASLKNYISSVCAVPGSRQFVASSARGDAAVVLSAEDGKLLQLLTAQDVSGIAATADSLYRSNGAGELQRYDQGLGQWLLAQRRAHTDRHWDNHLSLGAYAGPLL